MGIKVKLGSSAAPFRASYVNAFKPKVVKGSDNGKEVYSVMALFAPGADLAAAKAAALEAVKEKLGADKAEAIVKHPKFKSPFKNQAELVDDEGGQRPGTEAGGIFINLSNALKPLVLGPDCNEIMDAREFYSGCYAVASCEVYAWEHPTGGKGVTFSLLGIQKVRDGDRLGGTGIRADVSDFEPVAGADNGGAGTAGDVFG